MNESSQIRRLTWFNYFYLSILILGAAAWYANRAIVRSRSGFEQVRVFWEADGGLTFGSGSDGPFIIEGLTLSDKIARLPEPVIIIESGRVTLTRQGVAKLVWYERMTRERVAAPPKGAPVHAVYYKGLKSMPAK